MITIKRAYIFILAMGLTPLTIEAYASPLNCENITTEETSKEKFTTCIESNSIDDHFKSSYNKHSYTL